MENAVFWDVTRVSSKNRRFGGTYRLHNRVKRTGELGTLAQLASTANVVPGRFGGRDSLNHPGENSKRDWNVSSN
jgi:hypothetical protein